MTLVQREWLVVGFAEWWNGEWMGPSRFTLRSNGLLWPLTPSELTLETDITVPGTLFTSLTDFHVHLGLVDIDALWAGGLTAVHDLGWRPQDAERWRASSRHMSVSIMQGPLMTTPVRMHTPHEISVVGALLSCRGGYPSHSGWAPPGATIELDDPSEAEAAVTAQRALGASAIKVTLNSDAGPVPSDELLAAIVVAATSGEKRMDVIAHVQGLGQAERAFNAGVGILAHAPFSERLSNELLAAMANASGQDPTPMVWISTLDIHGWGKPTREFEIAQNNVRRFHAAGGRVLYGTDLGNGPLPQGLNERELLALAGAGLDREALLNTISPSSMLVRAGGPVGLRFAWAPGLPPGGAAATASWIATARSTTATHLKESLA